MKRSIASIAVMALTIVSVASFMMRSARADIVVFTAVMLAQNEVPPITNADQNAFGNVTVTVDTVTNLYRFDWSVGNIASSAIILSHIHEGPAGVIGPVRVDSNISPASPITPVNGNAAFSRSGLPGPADVTTRLLANPGAFYFNVHTNLNPVGVVRGQLVRQAASATTGAPTLSEWGAILMGLMIIAVCMFFLLGQRKTSVALPGVAPSTAFVAPMKTDWRLLASVTLCVEAVIVLALIVLSARTVDIAGALTSGLIVAYVLHLFIGAARRR